MKIKIKLDKDALEPIRGSEMAAGYDLYTCTDCFILHGKNKVPTGMHVEIPKGYQLEVRPRSGISINGMKDAQGNLYDCNVVLGTVDADYRGEIHIILYNHDYSFFLPKHSKIAQMVITKCEEVEWEEVDELNETERGDKGFGSTN